MPSEPLKRTLAEREPGKERVKGKEKEKGTYLVTPAHGATKPFKP